MSTFFFIAMLIAMLAVVLSLVLGLVVMTKGGEINKKYGNKLMQARVTLQGLAIALFILAVLTR
jgi:ABC-type antimicrobial peptide transport system permease subunit